LYFFLMNQIIFFYYYSNLIFIFYFLKKLYRALPNFSKLGKMNEARRAALNIW
jgi:hypothetical protein